MAVNRYELVSRHNPVLREADTASPLSVGNGNLAYTADITGMQTLYGLYEDTLPLCTMTQWGWHTKPVSEERYEYLPEEVEMTAYPFQGRTVRYAVEKKKGNEEIYDWLRQNPHRLNLARIGLKKDGAEIGAERISDIRQELCLYEGILDSRFALDGECCHVVTAADGETDTLAFQVESGLWKKGLTAEIAFPYGSPLISASNWEAEDAHLTEIVNGEVKKLVLKRTLDKDVYYVIIHMEGCRWENCGRHVFHLIPISEKMAFSVSFVKTQQEAQAGAAPGNVLENSRKYWKHFWEKGGAIDLHRSRDPRAVELERRIVLSQYLLAIQSAGRVPPQETGLTCNSWYGKFHLEMYLWHEAYLPLWNHTELLERSLVWYQEHLPQARLNAARNGYKGARWPKMIAEDAMDSPSPIAVLLVWQQPHIIYMLEMAYGSGEETAFLEKYYELVEETAEFMADFAVYNEERKVYELLGPLIPVQECHDPMVTRNPSFEVEYWSLTLKIAAEWAKRLGRKVPEKWLRVAENMAPMAVREGKYLAHEQCPDTYTAFAEDHPSMLCSYGLIDSGRTDRVTMGNSLREVEKCWNYPSLWGWDFAVMCMTAVRLGEPEHAIELLLKDTEKNSYVASGNNFQRGRSDLPLYLPGNGSLLLAAALMTAGYPGSGELPGFPRNGQWEVEFEGIRPFPC
nr:glycoside hydrolase family 65 [uncultured Acetatifactor sp.]